MGLGNLFCTSTYICSINQFFGHRRKEFGRDSPNFVKTDFVVFSTSGTKNHKVIAIQ